MIKFKLKFKFKPSVTLGLQNQFQQKNTLNTKTFHSYDEK